jgi:hypothetical protein
MAMIDSSRVPASRRLPTPDEVDLATAKLSYDRDSDMLLIHFTDRGRSGVVDYVSDLLAVLVDVETEAVVGLQVEDFLSKVVPADPDRLDLLEIAELRGITSHEVAALRKNTTVGDRKRSAVASLMRRLGTSSPGFTTPTSPGRL